MGLTNSKKDYVSLSEVLEPAKHYHASELLQVTFLQVSHLIHWVALTMPFLLT